MPAAPPRPGKGGKAPKAPAPPQTWASAILAALGAPVTQNNLNKLSAWNSCEGNLSGASGLGINNPFNTTLNYGGGTSVNSAGVKKYPSLVTGIRATVATIRESQFQPIYGNLRSDGSSSGFVSALGHQPQWGTDPTCVSGVLARGAPPITGPRVPGNTGTGGGAGGGGGGGGGNTGTSKGSSGGGAQNVGKSDCLLGYHGVHIGLFFGHGPTVGAFCVVSRSNARAAAAVLILAGAAFGTLMGFFLLAKAVEAGGGGGITAQLGAAANFASGAASAAPEMAMA